MANTTDGCEECIPSRGSRGRSLYATIAKICETWQHQTIVWIVEGALWLRASTPSLLHQVDETFGANWLSNVII